MHELSLCQFILEIVRDSISGKDYGPIKKISVEVGQLSLVDHAALLFSFDVVKKGTVAEEATLEIIEVEGVAICDACQKTVKLRNYYDPCPLCGDFLLEIIQGEELRVKFLETE